jgi:hypothetical protein
MRILGSGFAAFLAVAFLLPSAAIAQDDSTQAKPLERIVLKDGSEMVGRVESETATTLTVRSLSDVVAVIPKDQIQSRGPISGYVEGTKIFRNDPSGTRLFFGPTARTLKAGRGYFSIYEIFFPALGIGITDWFDVSGGLSLFPGAEQQIYYLGAKVVPLQMTNFNLGGGVTFLNVTGNTEDFDGAGILHVIGTYGTEKAALTVGLGWGFSGSDISNNPVFILGGEFRLSNSIKLISENWFPPSSDVQLISFGVRFFGERLAADFGLCYPAGGDPEGFPFLPWIGFTYAFGAP